MRLLGRPPFRSGLRGLDLLNFFLADAQTGFGAFIAVYLTSEKWTELQIGEILSIGTIATIVSQIPAGMLVDAMRNKRAAVAAGILSLAGAALLFAAAPFPLPVAIAEILHGFASCALTPAIAALSLKLVGHAALGDRLGRNARFASMGSAVAAAVMGGLGTYIAPRAVFLMTAAIAVPALWALARITPDPSRTTAPSRMAPPPINWAGVRTLLTDRRLVAFAACVVMFHLANAAMLPIAASDVTASAGAYASLIIAVCIVVPQIVVAITSPWVGHHANLWGRRPVMLLGWAALPLRGLLFALLPAPWMIVVTQALDGVSAAVFGVMLPLMAADLTLRSGRFNLCMGIFGLTAAMGAAVSTSLAGWIADIGGDAAAFLALAGAGTAGLLLVFVAMPETRGGGTAPEAARPIRATGSERRQAVHAVRRPEALRPSQLGETAYLASYGRRMRHPRAAVSQGRAFGRPRI